MRKIIQYILFDLLRNRIVIAYTFFLLLISIGLFSLQGPSEKALLTVWNLSLIVVPMMSLIFPTIYFYNSWEFIQLLSAQPIPRRKLLLSEWVSLAIVLVSGFIVGVGLPVLVNIPGSQSLMVVISGTLLTAVFVGLSVLTAVFTRDKTRGMGISLMMWLYFALLFDSLVLLILFNFSDYPLEKPMIIMSLLNPAELARILVLLKMEASALMGFTGAVFRDFVGSGIGITIIIGTLLIWTTIPILAAIRIFDRKDL